MPEEHVQRRLAAILAADVVGYSRLMGEDEEGTLAALTAHLTELIEPCITEHRGRLFKTTGDGLLAEFASVVDAVRCAVAYQEGMADRNRETPGDRRIEFRIGINLGDVIIQDDDVFGDGVNVASRLEGLAEPGGICVSDMVHQGIRSKLEVSFDDLGPQRVKNIADPVHAFHIRPGTPAVPEPAQEDVPPLPDKPSIAVLPFENMSADPEQEYFSDGITEDIITELSKISGLFVIARHSAFTYKGKSVTLKQVGRELGVRYVLEGSVRKAGNRLRITAQLIDADTDHHLWAERYDRDMDEIFAVQEEVARHVADALRVTLKPDESERLHQIPTENVETYELYLRIRTTPWPPTRENLLSARSAYQRIIDVDPSFAGGYAGKSITYSLALIFGQGEGPTQEAEIALQLANQAMDHQREFGQSISALALAYSALGDHGKAVEAARRGFEIYPGDSDTHNFGAISLMLAGRGEEARAASTKAIRINPQYVASGNYNGLGLGSCIAGKYEEAIKAFERNVELGGPIAAPALVFWTTACVEAGRVDDAKTTARLLLDFVPQFSISRFRFLHMLKNRDDSDRVVNALRQAGLPE